MAPFPEIGSVRAACRALGQHHELLRRSHRLLIIDELGNPPTPAEGAAILFQLISRRYMKGSVILTTNRSVTEWGEIFGNSTIAAAMLDRLLRRGVVLDIAGDTSMLRGYQAQAAKYRKKGVAE